MTDVILFHHAHGRTEGIEAFAEAVRSTGHRVIVPDLYDGETFETLEEGVAHAESIGMETIIDRGVAAAKNLSQRIVYAGFSLGVLPAQKLAQTRPGTLGALLYHEGIAASNFGTNWPRNVALQVHVSEDDQWCELDVTRKLVEEAADGELFLYPGSSHLFTDESLAEYDADAAKLVLQHTIGFLNRWS